MIHIDFTKKEILQESFLKMWGFWNKKLLKYIYGEDANVVANLNEEDADEVKFVIRGEEVDVRAYAQAIVAEKNYLDDFVKYGAEHPKSQKTKELLDQAVDNFEQTTGITWPFKDEE